MIDKIATMVKSKSPQGVGDTIVSKSEASVEEEKKEKESFNLAHDLTDVSIDRTGDISTTDDVEFKNMLLPDFILNGLTAANFLRPSPIQLRSIPLLRLGLDLIVQSKAGTGKTLVITLAALETLKFDSKRLQVLALAPTREIALQTKQFISVISSEVPVRTEVFIGGTSVKEDRKNLLGCQIAIGTPGRLNSLIESSDMSLGHVKLFVLDEADKLMDESIFSQIKSISKLLPPNKQTILCSATFLHPVKNYVVKHMKEPFWVTPTEATRFQAGSMDLQKSMSNVLLGVTQFVKDVPNHPQIVRKLRFKLEEILEILSGHSFTQCMIFSNYQTRAETICHQLVTNGWPAMSVRGQDEQSHRTAALNSFKELGCRILLTTDVMSRGVDFRGVDLVINLDIPYDSSTYLHRMGRAGRFGSHGCVVTIASQGEELESFKKILSEIGDVTVYTLPSELSLMKQGNEFQTVFYKPNKEYDSSSEQRSGFEDIGDRMRKISGSTQDEQNKELPQVQEGSGNTLEEREQAEPESISSSVGKINHENVEDCDYKRESEDIKKSFSLLKVDVEKVCSTAFSRSDNQMGRAVKEANACLSRALYGPKQKSIKFKTFQELEKNIIDWTVADSNCEILPSKDSYKPKDWWTSANVVLTAANLQLQEQREKSLPEKDVQNYVSDSSSESILNTPSKENWKNFKPKKRVKKLQKSQSYPSSSGNLKSDVNTKSQDEWHWDESSKLYYNWDSGNNFYHLYNPYLNGYFKWEPDSNRYFKFDSSSQIYRLWNCVSGSYCQTSTSENNYRSNDTYGETSTSSHRLNQNCVSWFTLWNKQLRLMSMQMCQAEYLKNMTSVYHRK